MSLTMSYVPELQRIMKGIELHSTDIDPWVFEDNILGCNSTYIYEKDQEDLYNTLTQCTVHKIPLDGERKITIDELEIVVNIYNHIRSLLHHKEIEGDIKEILKRDDIYHTLCFVDKSKTVCEKTFRVVVY